MNPNLGASARMTQAWMQYARGSEIELLPVLRQAGDLSNWMKRNGFAFHLNAMAPLDRSNPVKWGWSFARLLAWLRGRRVDVIHCFEHDLWQFAWPLRRMLKAPAVCHFHFSVSPEYATWAFRGTSRRPNHSLWTSIQQRADSAEAVAPYLPAADQSIVFQGMDLNVYGKMTDEGHALRERLGIRDDQVVVGCACALRDRKRVDDFLDVVDRLTAKHSQVVGLVAGGPVPGEEAYGARVGERLRAMQTQGKLHWVGHMEPVEPAYHASDIQVSTSEYETFGMSVCEAMACARPVAAYRGGSVAEVLGDAGLVVETGDLDGLTVAVERLVVNAERRKALGTAARQRVADHFNPRNSFEQVVEIYQSLLGKPAVTLRPQVVPA